MLPKETRGTRFNRLRASCALPLSVLLIACAKSEGKEVPDQPAPSNPSTDGDVAGKAPVAPEPPGSLQFTGSFAGEYTVSDSTENHDGVLSIEVDGDSYKLKWGTGHEGVGLESDSTLVASFGKPGPGRAGFINGVMVVQPEAQAFSGRWVDHKRAAFGSAKFEGPPGYEGLYRQHGTNEKDGSTFEGTIELLPEKNHFTLVDRVWGRSEVYRWTAYKFGSGLAVAYGSFTNNRMIVFRRDGNVLNGTIVQGDMVSLGRERAQKK